MIIWPQREIPEAFSDSHKRSSFTVRSSDRGPLAAGKICEKVKIGLNQSMPCCLYVLVKNSKNCILHKKKKVLIFKDSHK